MSTIKLLVIYELPSSLKVTASCFGKSYRVRLGNLKGVMKTPMLSWATGADPQINEPPMSEDENRSVFHYAQGSKEGWEKRHYWGNVSGYNPEKRKIIKAALSTVLLEFSIDSDDVTYSDYLYGRGHPMGNLIDKLFLDAENWFESLRTWVEVAIDQDTNLDDPIASARQPGRGLHIFAVEKELVSLPASPFNIVVNLNSDEPVNLKLFRAVILKANAGDIPDGSHLLLSDSRSDFRRNRYRKAVIDAGSAVEMCLKELNTNITHINTPPKPTLGWFVGQTQIANTAQLPTNTQVDLVDIRNDAIHHNIVPGRDTTSKAIQLAESILNFVNPLSL
jgi:hypothetical protein